MRLWVRGPDVEFEVVAAADTTGHRLNLTASVDTAKQRINRLRATSAQSVNRGNTLVTERFDVRRELSSRPLAESYVRLKLAQVPTGVGLFAELLDYDGVTTLYMPKCSLVITGYRVMGVEAIITYELSGGCWQTDNPNLTD